MMFHDVLTQSVISNMYQIELYVWFIFFRKTETLENEIVNAQSYPHPTKLPFNISDEIQKDIKIAADNIDK